MATCYKVVFYCIFLCVVHNPTDFVTVFLSVERCLTNV